MFVTAPHSEHTSGYSQLQQSFTGFLGNILSQNIYHFWYIIICKTGIRILLGKAQPYVKSEQGSLPLMSFYLFGCCNNYCLERGRMASENGHSKVFQTSACLDQHAREKRNTEKFNQKLEGDPPERHTAKATTGNGACASEGWVPGGAECLGFLMEERGFPCLHMARAIFPEFFPVFFQF